jgi:hypothetical protein
MDDHHKFGYITELKKTAKNKIKRGREDSNLAWGIFRSDSPSSGYMTSSDVFSCFSIPALFAISFNLDSAQLQISGEYKLQIEEHTNYGIVNLA